ncbi:hypothetical protein FWH58_03590, partial [Candidatus Saccharibacteria bacterium]|nr:hypothetical protein [Candidatus Saccharibacteria bacterium]
DHPSQTSSSRSRLLLASPRRQPSGDLAPAQDLDEEFGRDDLTPPAEINWDNVLAEVGNLDEPAVLATLKFADHEYENGRLTLYFSKTFHRKKADTAKFSGVLNKAFQKLYDYDVEIRVAKTPVRENSDAARILDIMGGGEMVRHGQTE